MESTRTKPLKYCTFCNTLSKRLGNHLLYCHAGENRRSLLYLLSEKTPTKKNRISGNRACPTCGKYFTKLDIYLMNNTLCKSSTLSDGLPSSHTEPTDDQELPLNPLQQLKPASSQLLLPYKTAKTLNKRRQSQLQMWFQLSLKQTHLMKRILSCAKVSISTLPLLMKCENYA